MYITKSKEVALEGTGKREVGKSVAAGCSVSMRYNLSSERPIALLFEEYHLS